MAKLPRNGRCPHCDRMKPVLNRGHAEPTMDNHNYHPSKGKVAHCPGSGRPAKPGTAK